MDGTLLGQMKFVQLKHTCAYTRKANMNFICHYSISMVIFTVKPQNQRLRLACSAHNTVTKMTRPLPHRCKGSWLILNTRKRGHNRHNHKVLHLTSRSCPPCPDTLGVYAALPIKSLADGTPLRSLRVPGLLGRRRFLGLLEDWLGLCCGIGRGHPVWVLSCLFSVLENSLTGVDIVVNTLGSA